MVRNKRGWYDWSWKVKGNLAGDNIRETVLIIEALEGYE